MENNKQPIINEDKSLYSLIDMITNPKYRKKVYDYYDSIYEESKEEKEMFEAMTNRRELDLNKLKDKLSTKLYLQKKL